MDPLAAGAASMGAMTEQELLAHCLAKPGAWQDEPWEGHVVAKVGDKMFAMFGVVGERPGPAVGIKVGRSREEAEELVARYPGDVAAMAYIGRYGWNTVPIGGAVADDELRELVDASYDDVVARLPRAKRPVTG